MSLKNSNLGQKSFSFMGPSILEKTLKNSNLSQKRISFMWPSIWNKLSNNKFLKTATSFTHDYKKLVEFVEHNFNHNFYHHYHY